MFSSNYSGSRYDPLDGNFKQRSQVRNYLVALNFYDSINFLIFFGRTLRDFPLVCQAVEFLFKESGLSDPQVGASSGRRSGTYSLDQMWDEEEDEDRARARVMQAPAQPITTNLLASALAAAGAMVRCSPSPSSRDQTMNMDLHYCSSLQQEGAPQLLSQLQLQCTKQPVVHLLTS